MFDSTNLAWTTPENNFWIDSFDPVSQIQPLVIDEHANISAGSEVTSGNRHADNRHDNNLKDDGIRVLEHELAPRPKKSTRYLGIEVPDTLQSPDVFLQLTSMSVTLESLARQLPSFTVHKQAMNSQSTQPDTSDQIGDIVSDDEVNFSVSKAYALTHQLADIYIPLIEQTRQRKGLSGDGIRDPAGRSMEFVDFSLLWLLFSCHNRLIDLWHAMLIHAKMVHDNSDVFGSHKALCARFKMGPYEPSSSSTVVAMEIIVLQELAMHLATRLHNLIKVIQLDDSTDGSSNTTEANLQSLRGTVLAARALHGRALAMCTEIAQRKTILEDSIAEKASIKIG